MRPRFGEQLEAFPEFVLSKHRRGGPSEVLSISHLSVTLPMPPSLANASGQSRHWRSIASAKKRYYRQLDELQLINRIPAPPATPIGKATVAIVMQLGARMDVDNAAARCKWPLDWLATRGYLENDRLLEWAGMPVQDIKRRAAYAIAFTFTPAATT